MVKKLIGVDFKKALETHIPKGHILHSVINCHVTKLAYCSMPNMEAKVSGHNRKVEANNAPINPDIL